MPYANKQDLLDTYGERLLLIVADRDRDNEVDDAVVTAACDMASAEIDSYLSSRYPVPLANYSPMVRLCCMDIALYRMAWNENASTQEIKDRYDSAVGWLKQVLKGDVSATAGGGSGGIDPGNVTQPGSGASIIPTVTNGGVTGLTLVSGGSNYVPTNGTVPLVFTGGGGNGAAGTATVSDGVVIAVELTLTGSGYTTLPTVVVGITGSYLDPSMHPPAVTGGKRAGVFYSQNRWSNPRWHSPRRRTIPQA